LRKIENKAITIVICGHGSRHDNMLAEFRNFIRKIKIQFPKNPLSHGFLEISDPNIETTLKKVIKTGAKKILVIPVMLFAAGHIKKDIPNLIRKSLTKNSKIEVKIAREIGIDKKLLKVAKQKIEKTLQTSPHIISERETMLMVIGRGTSLKKVNEKIVNISRSLKKQMKFSENKTSFVGVATPDFKTSLTESAKKKFKRIVIFPYLLFTGTLLNRIHAITGKISQQFPETEFLISSCFKDHPLVIKSFTERIMQGLKRFC
jgi:sirohydrochlorin cobaltochelatase